MHALSINVSCLQHHVASSRQPSRRPRESIGLLACRLTPRSLLSLGGPLSEKLLVCLLDLFSTFSLCRPLETDWMFE